MFLNQIRRVANDLRVLRRESDVEKRHVYEYIHYVYTINPWSVAAFADLAR